MDFVCLPTQFVPKQELNQRTRYKKYRLKTRKKRSKSGSTMHVRTGCPGKSGDLTSASASGARCVRTTVTTAMPGTTSLMIRRVLAHIGGEKMELPGSQTINNNCALPLLFGMDAIPF